MRLFVLLYVLIGISLCQANPCSISLLIPFHDGRTLDVEQNASSSYSPSVVTAEDVQRDGITHLAAALMAIEDFNTRESSLVTNISSYDDCSIQFSTTPVVVDSGRDPTQVEQTRDHWLTPSTCAVVGPVDNEAALAMALELEGLNVSALSYGARASSLADETVFPNLWLGTVEWENIVQKLMDYLNAKHRHSVGILYTPGDNLDFSDFSAPFEDAQGLVDFTLRTIATRTESEFRTHLQAMKDDRRTTIVVALASDDNVDVLAAIADELGMLSSAYVWIFLDTFLLPQFVPNFEVSPPDPLAKLLSRSRILHLLDGLASSSVMHNGTTYRPASVQFQEEWQNRGALMVDQLNDLLHGLLPSELSVDSTFFMDNAPAYGAGYLYDAIMSLGISQCSGTSPLEVEHEGPSGKYRFVGRSLDPDALTFAVYSLQPTDNGFQATLRDISVNGIWEEDDPIHNYFDTWVTVLVLVLASLTILYCIGSCYFVYHFRNNRIVSVGQPEFLYIICFGASLMAIGALFLPFDEEDGWTKNMLDTKCVVIVWLSNLGLLIIYMAMFSKLWRVGKVMQMRRGQEVGVRHVLAPFAVLVTANVAVLIAYTIVDGPEWTWDYALPEEDLESIGDQVDQGTVGYCHESGQFTTATEALFTVATILLLCEACKTKHLPEDISDSKRVFQTMIAHLILIIVGVVAFVYASAEGQFNFALLSLAFVELLISATAVGFLVIPKMYYVYVYRETGELPSALRRGQTRVTGVSLTVPSSMLSGIETARSTNQTRVSDLSTTLPPEPKDSQANVSAHQPRGHHISNTGEVTAIE